MKKKLMLFLSSIMYILVLIAIIKVKLYVENTICTIHNEQEFDFRITSESCIVLNYDDQQILFQKNAYRIMLPASITKILTCVCAIELYNLDDYLYITDDMINCVGSKMYLASGDYVKISTLLYGLMLTSGNDAAKALSLKYSGKEEDFVDYMNIVAQRIGMKNSKFSNPSGLDEHNMNYTTAYDMAVLTAYALHNSDFKTIFGTKQIIIKEQNHQFILRHKHRLMHTNKDIIGGKTGYTIKAKRTLVSAFQKNNTTIIIVSLNAYDDWTLHENLANFFLS